MMSNYYFQCNVISNHRFNINNRSATNGIQHKLNTPHYMIKVQNPLKIKPSTNDINILLLFVRFSFF